MANGEIAVTVGFEEQGLGAGLDLSANWQNEMLQLTREIRDNLSVIATGSRKSNFFSDLDTGENSQGNLKKLLGGGLLGTSLMTAPVLFGLLTGNAKDEFEKQAKILEEGMAKWQEMINDPRYQQQQELFKREDAASGAFKPIEGIADAEKEIARILDDQKVTLEEMKQLNAIEDFLQQSRLGNQQEMNKLLDDEGVVLSENIDQRGYILDLLLKIGEAKKIGNAATREGIAVEQTMLGVLEKQATAAERAAKAKKYSKVGDDRVGPSGRMGQYDIQENNTGKTYTGYNERLNGKDYFVGIR